MVQREAESRTAIAEAERAELLARPSAAELAPPCPAPSPGSATAMARAACSPRPSARPAGTRSRGWAPAYLGELDPVQHDRLLARVRTLAIEREYANRIAIVEKLADGAKRTEKKDLAAIANAAGALLKTIDAFIESLKAGEASDKSPLFKAARYLGYASRTVAHWSSTSICGLKG